MREGALWRFQLKNKFASNYDVRVKKTIATDPKLLINDAIFSLVVYNSTK